MEKQTNNIFTDSSRLITESLALAGADVFIGYPITPANLLYFYSAKRFPVFMAAPDEITTVQWMSGYAATGKIPVTATSFPGYALMLEGINMACMMELPMVIVLVQRLGPATGTATRGSQGDIALLNGTISGGMSLPVFSLSDAKDCWEIPAKAVRTAVEYRTPVIILASKEEVMTMYNLDKSKLEKITKVERAFYNSDEPFLPYLAGENMVPPFLPYSNTKHQVRVTASTHDTKGILQNSTKESLDNSRRLHGKLLHNLDKFTFYLADEQEGAETLIISFGITSQAAKEAVKILREQGKKISQLVAGTLLPVPPVYYEISKRYKLVIIAEENLTGQYRQILFGQTSPDHIKGINEFGNMINPETIINSVFEYEQAIFK